MYKGGLKRSIDFIIVLCTLVVIWPILLLIIIFLHFANKGAGVFLLRTARVKMPRYSKLLNLKQ